MTRVLVVGSGIAGLTAALHAVAAGAEVCVASKSQLAASNTLYAQGGIASAQFPEDRVADHISDTLAAGAGLADPEAVRVLATEGPERVRELIALGVPFDRDEHGSLRRGLEAAHSFPRIVHAGGDATGAAIESTLVDRVRTSGIRLLEHTFLCDIDTAAADALEAELLLPTGRRERERFDAIILATGGAGQLYSHTTNPAVATTDGIAVALRAGAHVQDLEFVQFHPTVLAAGAPFLISEAVRGEGAVLRDGRGRRFASDVDPRGELAPRDVVARAITDVMNRGEGPVTLDATVVGPRDVSARARFLAERFPTIDAVLRDRGIEWARTPVPVTPAAHYLMGGVRCDLDGRTDVPRLFVAGEVARTGVHGANRLASNSLLEGAVFGARAGRAAVIAPAAAPTLPTRPAPPRPVVLTAPADLPFSRANLQDLMWTQAGLLRDADGLARARATLTNWGRTLPTARSVQALEDRNLLLVARAVVEAAAARTTSIGAHHRTDADRSETRVLAGAAC